MVSREEIRWAYRALLGRLPESDDAYHHHSVHADFESLRCALIASEEGLAVLRAKMNAAVGALPFAYFRPVTVLLHIQKTGGTALHEWLCEAIRSPAMSQAHTAYLPGYTLAELNQLDFVSGHFTYQEAVAIPRDTRRIICCFRDPIARLVSLYRFYRAHPAGAVGSPLAPLARRMTAEEFFADEEVRRSGEVDNRYLRVFCDGVDAAESEALAGACDRVDRLDAVAISEDMDRSAALIARRFGFGPMPPPRRLHATDQLRAGDGFSVVPPVAVTRRLRELIEPLIEHDRPIYRHARMRLLADLSRLAPATQDPRPTAAIRTR